MTQDELQKKYDRLFDKARRVRGWQKQWYKYHVEQDRQMMVMQQRDLDNMIALEVAERKKRQKELF